MKNSPNKKKKKKKREGEREILEKVQDGSNPFSHRVLPAAETCNS